MVELGPPLSAESTPPVFVTAPVVEAALVVVEHVQPAHVVEYVTPAPVEQIVDDPIPPLLRVIKTTKEEIERNEKRLAALATLAALLERVFSRDRRKLQKEIDDGNADILHQHQILQSTKIKLASIRRELHAKRRRVEHH